MKLKTIFTSINASFDGMVRKIENHEAVADCVIQEVRQSAAKIRSQLNLAYTRQNIHANKEKQLLDDCRRWRERAIACRKDDEEKALRCVQSLKNAENSLGRLQHQMRENQQLIDNLESHLTEVEQHLAELQNKKESLSARAARNKAASCVQHTSPPAGFDNVFERWETQVTADEYGTVAGAGSSDSLDREFRQQEDKAALKAELNALVDDVQSPVEEK